MAIAFLDSYSETIRAALAGTIKALNEIICYAAAPLVALHADLSVGMRYGNRYGNIHSCASVMALRRVNTVL
jgi:hypothetical protein